MNALEDILIPIGFFAMVFGIVYIAVTANHRQRMAMIEKGLAPAEAAARPEPHRSLKLGMMAVGVGLGLLLGYLFQTHAMVGDGHNPLPYFVMVLLCGGIALIGYHLIVRRKEQG